MNSPRVIRAAHATMVLSLVLATVLPVTLPVAAQQAAQQAPQRLAPPPAQPPAQPPQVISYAEALRLALQRNVTVRQAQATVESNAIAASQARRNLLPDFRFNTSGAESYGRNFNQSDGQIVNRTIQTLNAGVSSGVTLFDGKRNLASIRQAESNATASEQDAARTRQTALYTVAANYVAMVAQREQLTVREQALAAQRGLEAQVQAFVDAGTRSIADLYAQQAAVASANLDVVQARRALELARLEIIRTLQLDPAGNYDFTAPPLTDTATTPPLDSLIARALAHRADLTAQVSRLQAANAAVNAASATRWPTLSLSLGYNTSYSSVSDFGFVDQLDQRRGGSVSLGFSLPIFDKFSTRSATQQATIQLENARLALEKQRLEVGLEVRQAWLDLTSAREQLVAAEAQQRSAEMALTASRERYQAGAATLVELAQARATQVQAATALVNARYNLILQQTVVAYATGALDASTMMP